MLAVWLMMRRHRAAFGRLIDRVTAVSYPGGQIDLAAMEAEQQAQVEELAERASDPDAGVEECREVAHKLADEAEQLGRVRAALEHPEPAQTSSWKASEDIQQQIIQDRVRWVKKAEFRAAISRKKADEDAQTLERARQRLQAARDSQNQDSAASET